MTPTVPLTIVVDHSLETEVKKPEVERVQARDCVADLIAAVDSGRVKGKQFSKEIKDFSPEDLGRLSEQLLLYYFRKFR